jgi:hypothetical protein
VLYYLDGNLAMSKADDKPRTEFSGADDALSATGMFQSSFRREPDPFAAPAPIPWQTPPAPRAPKPVSSKVSPSEGYGKERGEFTQLFGTAPAGSVQPPPVTPADPSGPFTQMFFASQDHASTPTSVPKVKGFSSPGASDSASAEGSSTELFSGAAAGRAPVPAQAPFVEKREWAVSRESAVPRKPAGGESPGVTELLRALSGNEGSRAESLSHEPVSYSAARPVAPPSTVPTDSFTVLLKKLTECPPTPQNSMPQNPVPQNLDTLQQPGPPMAAPTGHGEYTRVVADYPTKPAGVMPSAPVGAETKVFPAKLDVPKVAAPPLASPAVSPPKSKLQEMMPILTVLNTFLMVVVIVLLMLALLHR